MVSEKTDLLLKTNAAAQENGATFAASNLFQVNEQKYFASSEGSYIDQDIHRIWPTFTVTTIDKAAGLFKTRQALSAPMGMGYEYMIPKNEDKMKGPSGVTLYKHSYDMVEDAILAAKQSKEMLRQSRLSPANMTLCLNPITSDSQSTNQ